MAKFTTFHCTSLASFIITLSMLNPSFAATTTTTYNVISFGAKPNGVTDSTKAFLNAWSAACASPTATVIQVPKGRYLLQPLTFQGNCKSPDISFQIDGTIVAPADYRILGRVDDWIGFEGVSGVSIIGGAIDGNGPALWDCKAKGKDCPSGATALRFSDSSKIKIDGLKVINSQMFHIAINRCQDVVLQGVKIIAAGNSPNTDGIHVQLSRNVAFINSSVQTGDDCVSIGPGTKNLWIERITCGPGHGISIGSLAKDLEEEGVQNVTVTKAIFIGAENGFRIKSWARPSKGFVQGVQFIDAIMQNVQNPIIVDQKYCPRNDNCPGQTSGVKISDVLYKNIRGTSASRVAINFQCSSTNPCTGIRLEDVKLTYMNKPAQSSCVNANGKSFGMVEPNGCL
ncbi:polygalacturonase [Ziziphus jujuba]|uniref:Polygalacturonase n=1 Tax=Ziziphus jujuba TaxID=326968 RepID=A0A6P6GKD6_ZIZJJ|nr:polygalacturonase [Ziziphus jujuba]